MKRNPARKRKTPRTLEKSKSYNKNLVERGLAQHDMHGKLILTLNGEKLLGALWKKKYPKALDLVPPREKAIQKIGRLFFGWKAKTIPDARYTRSLMELGYIGKRADGKLVLTEKGIRTLFFRLYEITPKTKSSYFDYPFDSIGYSDIFGVLKRKLKTFKGKKVLEIGFMQADFLEILRKSGAEVSGLEQAKFKERTGMDLRRGSFEELDKHFNGKKFDSIVSRAVFEPGDDETLSYLSRESYEIGDCKRARIDVPQREKLFDERVVNLLKQMNEKLNENGFLVFETFGPSFIQNKHLSAAGFSRALMPPRKKGESHFLVAVKE